jgi:hypothetical protein
MLMDLALTPYLALFLGGIAAILVAIGWVLARRDTIGSPAIAAALAGGFAAYSGVTIWAEGLLPVLANHTSNLWGVQVWWDLLISVTIALFLIGCTAKTENPSGAGNTPAAAVATDTSAKFELGKNV